MFSFHKPRVYRSTEGCCICRAKSSSSRFTDSRKYEDDSMKCFNLKHPRHGEICNACVLLVKRYKRLPAGSTRNWGHVVDARAGPGTKSLTKQKRTKGDNEPIVRGRSKTHNSTKSLLQEKFSKIFKKTKKNKITNSGTTNSSVSTNKKDMSRQRKNINSNTKSWRDHGNISLPTTPDSLDSDYEESRLSMPANGTTVQFQTQTRASSYRSRKNSIAVTNLSGQMKTKHNHKRLPKVGSKRRKLLQPKKNRTIIDNVQFFDDNEWQKKKSCCGTIYESKVMIGALIIDLENFKPCAAHQKAAIDKQLIPVNTTIQPLSQEVIQSQMQTQMTQLPQQSQSQSQAQKSIIATMPAIVQLAPPVIPIVNTKPTQVLKKHHLFFKRQSESFPHGDLNNFNSNNNNTNNNSVNNNCNNSNNTINTSNTITARPLINITSSTMQQLSSSHMHMTNLNMPSVSILPAGTTTIVTSSSNSNYTSNSIHLPKHSTAKITTITQSAAPSTTFNKAHNLLHKVKATENGGKVMKHTLEKINTTTTTGLRIKPNEIPDMKHMIKTVDKSYMVARPSIATISSVNGQQPQLHIHQQAQQQQQQQQQQLHLPINVNSYSAGSSPSSTSSSSSSTKFSDNSSDSGFDENMLDRKSVSPLQEDTDRKIVTRPGPGVQTMFLASGVQIQGQQQNLVLTGNEVAAKILNNRKQPSNNAAPTNNAANIHPQRNNRSATTVPTAVKIAQIVASSSAGGAKIRAIYNNNTIQHENGVTTIVPASSLAATSQTAAMNAIAPSTVTITPAPHIATTPVATATLNNLNGKKHHPSGANIIGVTTNTNNGNIHALHQNNITHTNQNQTHNNGNNNTTNNITNASLNQKIILVKTATKYNSNNTTIVTPVGSMTTTTPTTTATILNTYNQNMCKK